MSFSGRATRTGSSGASPPYRAPARRSSFPISTGCSWRFARAATSARRYGWFDRHQGSDESGDLGVALGFGMALPFVMWSDGELICASMVPVEATMRAPMEPTMPETVVVMETVETIREEERTSSEERWAKGPWGCPIVGVLIRIGVDRLRRQRVDLRRQCADLRRQTGCVLGDLPAIVWLMARLPDGLLLLSSDRHGRGELAAVSLTRLLGGDSPTAVRLLARLTSGLLLLSSDRHRRGELATVRLRWTLGKLRRILRLWLDRWR
jgi:hypothetical protein